LGFRLLNEAWDLGGSNGSRARAAGARPKGERGKGEYKSRRRERPLEAQVMQLRYREAVKCAPERRFRKGANALESYRDGHGR